MLMVVVAYCTCSRGPLIRCTEFEDFKYFFHHRNAVDVGKVIQEAYRLLETTPGDIQPERMMQEFTPLTKGQYPVFNKYPKFIVNYQSQERERIRQEELEYLRQRQASLELQQETTRRQHEEEAWYRQQQLLVEAEEKRRKMIADEDQKLTDQRVRVQAMNRELKMKELQLLDATRRKFMTFTQNQKEAELKRLDDDIQRKASLRDQETDAAISEAQIRNMELQLQKKLFEQEMYREYVKSTQEQKAETEARIKQQEMEDQMKQNLNKEEMERELRIRKAVQESMAQKEQQNFAGTLRNQLDMRHRMNEINRETHNSEIANLHRRNQQLESEIQAMMEHAHTREQHVPVERVTDVIHLPEPPIPRFPAMPDHGDVRLDLLRQETDLARHQLQNMKQSLDESFEKLRKVKRTVRAAQQPEGLNSTATTESTQLSLDRGRKTFEEQEKALMDDVRKLRQKLAHETRTKRPPPAYRPDD